MRVIRRCAALGAPRLEAQKKIDTIQSDRTGPYWDSNHLEYKAVIEEVTRLFDKVYGARPAGFL